MTDVSKRKLLILGDTSAVLDVIRFAKDMGVTVYITGLSDYLPAQQLADYKVRISTTDINALTEFMEKEKIDGFMTGASEFNISNCIRLSEASGKNFYTTKDLWDLCANKKSFKNLCRTNGVPSVKEFDSEKEELFEYPVIVKPVDGCSARGISVCSCKEEFEAARQKALEYSASKKIIVEKFIENDGTTISSKYILRDGEIYLQSMGDRFVLDAEKGKSLITWAALYPSKHLDYYIENIDKPVKQMFKNAGLKNGCLFMEAMPDKDGIHFYEMGYRISGGMTYKITEITNDVNELKMLISHAITGEMCEESDLSKIDPYLNGKAACVITIPLECGTISQISGMEEIQAMKQVCFTTQYYSVGDQIISKHLGTLDQLFARFTIIADGKKELAECIDKINCVLSVKDENQKEMYLKRFDSKRIF